MAQIQQVPQHLTTSFKCPRCSVPYNFTLYHPMTCHCAKLTVCAACAVTLESLGTNYCCPYPKFDRDACFAQITNETNYLNQTIYGYVATSAQLSEELKQLRESNKLKDEKIVRLELEQERVQRNAANGVKAVNMDCLKCGQVKDEKSFSLCKLCTTPNSIALPEHQLKQHALCEACIEQDHKLHETVPYFQTLSTLIYKQHMIDRTEKNGKLLTAKRLFNKEADELTGYTHDIIGILDDITDLIGSAESSENLKEHLASYEECYNGYIKDAEEILGNFAEILNELKIEKKDKDQGELDQESDQESDQASGESEYSLDSSFDKLSMD